MYSLLLLAMVAMLAFMIFFPDIPNSAVLFRIPQERRPSADRLVPVALVAMFVFATFFFASLESNGYLKPLKTNLPESALAIVVLFLIAISAAACVFPVWFMSRMNPQLRKVLPTNETSQSAISKIRLVSRFFGVLILITAAFLARDLVNAF